MRKRRQDIWNEKAEVFGQVMEVEAKEFVNNVARNEEGIAADRAKFPLDETTTPKVLPPNKRS